MGLVALIICMSHCCVSSGSVVVTGVTPPGRSPLTFFFASCLYPDAPGPYGAATPAGVPSVTGTVRLAPTDSMLLPPKAVTFARKAALSASR